jgi:alkane 1-monooxygenase
VCYAHFEVEHLLGHHRNVATRADPASSRMNETLYQFYPRTVLGSLRSAWHLDRTRVITGHCTSLAMLAALFVLWRWRAVALFLIQSWVAFSLLEVINYVEHYGLQREPHEPVTIMHSWNQDTRITNTYLLQLMRHSDHHAFAGRRYQSLRSFSASPMLPFGYATMVLIAFFPELFKAIMNPLVRKFNAKKQQMFISYSSSSSSDNGAAALS